MLLFIQSNTFIVFLGVFTSKGTRFGVPTIFFLRRNKVFSGNENTEKRPTRKNPFCTEEDMTTCMLNQRLKRPLSIHAVTSS